MPLQKKRTNRFAEPSTTIIGGSKSFGYEQGIVYPLKNTAKAGVSELLRVDVVKVNNDIYKRIGMQLPSVPELIKMVNNDKPTWDLYAKGYTLGLNQTEKGKTLEKVKRYKPKNLTELSAFVAGVRPKQNWAVAQ